VCKQRTSEWFELRASICFNSSALVSLFNLIEPSTYVFAAKSLTSWMAGEAAAPPAGGSNITAMRHGLDNERAGLELTRKDLIKRKILRNNEEGLDNIIAIAKTRDNISLLSTSPDLWFPESNVLVEQKCPFYRPNPGSSDDEIRRLPNYSMPQILAQILLCEPKTYVFSRYYCRGSKSFLCMHIVKDTTELIRVASQMLTLLFIYYTVRKTIILDDCSEFVLNSKARIKAYCKEAVELMCASEIINNVFE